MAVPIEQILPGAVFRFKTADRRVVSLSEPVGSGFDVLWEYADGKKRGGRLGGRQWVYYFRSDAIEQVFSQSQVHRETIYFASKTRHAPRWRALRDAGVPTASTWIDEAGEG